MSRTGWKKDSLLRNFIDENQRKLREYHKKNRKKFTRVQQNNAHYHFESTEKIAAKSPFFRWSK